MAKEERRHPIDSVEDRGPLQPSAVLQQAAQAGQVIGDAGPAPHLLAEPASADEEQPRPLPPVGKRRAYDLIAEDTAAFAGRMRVLQAFAGAVLFAVFLLPWNGARSWELLQILRGADFVRQILFLVSGVTLLSTAILPVPVIFRAAVGAGLSLLALALGGALLSVWQTQMAVMVVALLTASLLLRVEERSARLPQVIGLMAVGACLALYLVPRDGVPPLRVAVELVYYRGDDMARFIGTYLLLPLPLICLAAVALIGTDVAVIGELLSWLLFFWGPGALLVLAIDRTQVYMAAAVLSYSICAGYGCAELLRRVSGRLSWTRDAPAEDPE